MNLGVSSRAQLAAEVIRQPTGPVHGSASWRIFRAAAGLVERRLAVPAPFELEEAVCLGHQRHPVPQPPAASPRGAGVTTGPKMAWPRMRMTGVPTSKPTSFNASLCESLMS